MSLRGIFDGGGVRKQNGHWQSSRKGMQSYEWYEDVLYGPLLPIVKSVRWNPLQQLSVSGSFDIDVKTSFDTIDYGDVPATYALFGISTNGKQVTHLKDQGFAYSQTIGAKNFNRLTRTTHVLPPEEGESYRAEIEVVEISLRGYSPREGNPYPYVSSTKTKYMVDNHIEPALRYYIRYYKYLYWMIGDNEYTRNVFNEEYETIIPLTITTTQQPIVIPRGSRTDTYYPVGNVLCTLHNQVNAHITYSFTIPAFDAANYPHIANEILSGNEYDFIVCVSSGHIRASEEDWGSKVQLRVSNLT